MSLPAMWVDRIFDRLSVVYGGEFLDRWRAIPLTDVKTNWGQMLAYYEADPGAIAWALENLPSGKPPTVLQFRDLCRAAPAKPAPMLPEPKADPERIKTEMEKLQEMVATKAPRGTGDGKDWARRILARLEAGEKIAAYTLRSARDALGVAGDLVT